MGVGSFCMHKSFRTELGYAVAEANLAFPAVSALPSPAARQRFRTLPRRRKRCKTLIPRDKQRFVLQVTNLKTRVYQLIRTTQGESRADKDFIQRLQLPLCSDSAVLFRDRIPMKHSIWRKDKDLDRFQWRSTHVPIYKVSLFFLSSLILESIFNFQRLRTLMYLQHLGTIFHVLFSFWKNHSVSCPWSTLLPGFVLILLNRGLQSRRASHWNGLSQRTGFDLSWSQERQEQFNQSEQFDSIVYCRLLFYFLSICLCTVVFGQPMVKFPSTVWLGIAITKLNRRQCYYARRREGGR